MLEGGVRGGCWRGWGCWRGGGCMAVLEGEAEGQGEGDKRWESSSSGNFGL